MESEITRKDFPKELSDKILIDHKGYRFIKIFQIEINRIITYRLILGKGLNEKEVFYDRSGIMIRNEK
jgi:hypothetical protein